MLKNITKITILLGLVFGLYSSADDLIQNSLGAKLTNNIISIKNR